MPSETELTQPEAVVRARQADTVVRRIVSATAPSSLADLRAAVASADVDRTLRPFLWDSVFRLVNAGELHVGNDRRVSVTDRFSEGS